MSWKILFQDRLLARPASMMTNDVLLVSAPIPSPTYRRPWFCDVYSCSCICIYIVKYRCYIRCTRGWMHSIHLPFYQWFVGFCSPGCRLAPRPPCRRNALAFRSLDDVIPWHRFMFLSIVGCLFFSWIFIFLFLLFRPLFLSRWMWFRLCFYRCHFVTVSNPSNFWATDWLNKPRVLFLAPLSLSRSNFLFSP